MTTQVSTGPTDIPSGVLADIQTIPLNETLPPQALDSDYAKPTEVIQSSASTVVAFDIEHVAVKESKERPLDIL